jgi:hypothetical protein
VKRAHRLTMADWFPDIFPIHLIWLSGLWTLIGGGASTTVSILYVMVTDAVTAESRTTAFSCIQASLLLSEFIAISASGWLMQFDPWIPLLGASALSFIGFGLGILFVPDTFTGSRRVSNGNWRVALKESIPECLCSWNSFKSTVDHGIKQRSGAMRWLRQNYNVVLVLLAFIPSAIGRTVVGLLLQYTSKKFHLPYGKVRLF